MIQRRQTSEDRHIPTNHTLKPVLAGSGFLARYRSGSRSKNQTQQVYMDPGLAKNWTQQVYMNLDLTLEPDLVVLGLGCSSQSQKPTGNTYKITRKNTSLI
jgi:hypothetical protein